MVSIWFPEDKTGLSNEILLKNEQESIAPLGVLPAMSFTPNNQEVIASYGGKIYRIPIDGGDAINIPFEVDEKIVLGPQLKFDYLVDDSPTFSVNQIRDTQISPDGSMAVFTALNKLYIMNFEDEKKIEAMPSWHPNGKKIVFVTWE